MADQAYAGTCPTGDPDGYRLTVKLSHPAAVRYQPTLTVGCPIEILDGEPCPDGGTHTLAAITAEQYDQEYNDAD